MQFNVIIIKRECNPFLGPLLHRRSFLEFHINGCQCGHWAAGSRAGGQCRQVLQDKEKRYQMTSFYKIYVHKNNI